MKKFIYTDNNKKEVLDEIIAEGILKADKIFNEKHNLKVEKCPHIGCQVKKV